MNRSKSISDPKTGIQNVLIAVFVFICLSGSNAQAHKVNLFAYVEGDKVLVEGYFSGNAKARDCAVLVYDETGKKVIDGKTDEKGVWSFKISDLPAFKGALKFVLDAEMGHKAEYTLSASDIPGSLPGDKPSVAAEQSQNKEPHATATASSTASTAAVDEAALVAAIEKAVDKKIEPVVRMLGKQEKLLLEDKQGGPRLSDIIGGIGWILGLAGITAFFLSRGRNSRQS